MTVPPAFGATAPSPLSDLVVATSFRMARVDLLPPEVRAARRLRATQRVLGATAAGVLAVVAGACVLAVHDAHRARAELVASSASTTRLQAAQAPYAQVPVVSARVAALRAARASAMASDVVWSDYLDRVARADPSHVWFSDLSATLYDQTTTPNDPLAPEGIGVLTVTADGYQHPDVADWMDGVDGTSGFAAATFSRSQRTELGGKVVVSFDASTTLTQDALSHRYDARTP